MSEFRVEFRDERKATSKYVSDIKGEKSTDKVSKAERVASQGIDSGNIISKSLHASSIVGLKVGGTIHLDNFEARVQTSSNNEFGRRHASLVTGRK